VKSSKINVPWWRYVRISQRTDVIRDPRAWREFWKKKHYPLKAKTIKVIGRLEKKGVVSSYGSWLLTNGCKHLLETRGKMFKLPREAERQIATVFDRLEDMLGEMSLLVGKKFLPLESVEKYGHWLNSFENDLGFAVPRVSEKAVINYALRSTSFSNKGVKKLLSAYRRLSTGRSEEPRVILGFLISEENKKTRQKPDWQQVAQLMAIVFPKDQQWCTAYTLSRAVDLYKKRNGEAAKILEVLFQGLYKNYQKENLEMYKMLLEEKARRMKARRSS